MTSRQLSAVPGNVLAVVERSDNGYDGVCRLGEPFTQPVIDGKPALGIGGYAFRVEDQEFVDEFNRHMVEIVKSPAYATMIKEFGFTEAEIPKDVTTAELCAVK